MFKKMMLTALVTLAFSVSASAAMNKAQAELQVRSQYAKEVKATDKYMEEYQKANGDVTKVKAETRKAFSEAIATIAGGKINMDSGSLQRAFILKPSVLADVVRIESSLKSNDAKEVAKAEAQRDLIESVGKSIKMEDYAQVDGKLVLKEEGQAALKLLSLDLLTLPEKATEVVKNVTQGIRSGKSITDAVKEGTKGIKGTLKDLIDCV